MTQERTYRRLVKKSGLVSFRVAVKETDLLVQAAVRLEQETLDLVLQYRSVLEAYIQRFPEFLRTLTPWTIREPAPAIIRDMAAAGKAAGVGPMAAVAGAVAGYVGTGLLSFSDQIVVENGGDIFMKIDGAATIAIFAGTSPLSLKIGLRMTPQRDPVGICTSSATVGHSLSFGRADAVTVISRDCALADAAATSVCNRVKSTKDIQQAVRFGRSIQGVDGLVVIIGDRIAMWGEFEIVPLK